MSTPKTHGFSLVELSIVLVILGLLTGGILSGQSLIRAAELRDVVAGYQRYQTAAHSFRDKYMAIPGDMKTATKFWGDDAAACADAAVTNGTPGTCNGDGNGQIDAGAAVSVTGEPFQFWKQLALAGLIEGTYSGLAGSGSVSHCVIGTNCPAAKISSVGWGVYSAFNSIGNSAYYALDYGNYFNIGGQTLTGLPLEAFLRPEEAWNVDIKVDDGKPARGKVIARNWDNACAAADDGTHAVDDLNASYKLSDSSLQCALYFRQLF